MGQGRHHTTLPRTREGRETVPSSGCGQHTPFVKAATNRCRSLRFLYLVGVDRERGRE